MSKVAGFVIGAILIGIGIVTGNVGLIIQGGAMIVTQAIVDLTMPKTPARQASEMTIQLGEQPRVDAGRRDVHPGSLVDGFNYGGKYGTDWEVLVIRLADHKCHSLTGFYVNDEYGTLCRRRPGIRAYDDQLEIYFRADTTTDPLPAIVTDHGPGWTRPTSGEAAATSSSPTRPTSPNDKHPAGPAGGRASASWSRASFATTRARTTRSPAARAPHRWDDPSTWEWSENPSSAATTGCAASMPTTTSAIPAKLLVGRGLSAAEGAAREHLRRPPTCATSCARNRPTSTTTRVFSSPTIRT
jgi:hypothetical protein